MIVIRDVGCDAGIYLSETELWWTVSLWVCVCAIVCLSGCVRVTSLPSQSAPRGWETPAGRLFGILDTTSFYCLQSSCADFHYTNYLATGFRLTLNNSNEKKQTAHPLSRHVIPSILSQHCYPLKDMFFLAVSHPFVSCGLFRRCTKLFDLIEMLNDANSLSSFHGCFISCYEAA